MFFSCRSVYVSYVVKKQKVATKLRLMQIWPLSVCAFKNLMFNLFLKKNTNFNPKLQSKHYLKPDIGLISTWPSILCGPHVFPCPHGHPPIHAEYDVEVPAGMQFVSSSCFSGSKRWVQRTTTSQSRCVRTPAPVRRRGISKGRWSLVGRAASGLAPSQRGSQSCHVAPPVPTDVGWWRWWRRQCRWECKRRPYTKTLSDRVRSVLVYEYWWLRLFVGSRRLWDCHLVIWFIILTESRLRSMWSRIFYQLGPKFRRHIK